MSSLWRILRTACTHPQRVIEPSRPTDAAYLSWHCPECGLRWRVPVPPVSKPTSS